MNIFTVKQRTSDLKRARFIAAAVFESGFGFLYATAQLKWLVPLECRIRCYLRAPFGHWGMGPPEQDLPARLRNLLIKLGPTYVKLGQVLSLRADILPESIRRELSTLTNQVPPFPYADVKRIVEEDLGQPISELFKNFEKTPLAAASIAQVHRANLPDGTPVAVKVQRPDIRATIEKDIRILRYVASIVEKRAPEWSSYRPVQVVDEFAETIRRELDFSIEAVHAKRFEIMFTGDNTVKVASTFASHTSHRVLTMDLISGVKLDDPVALEKAGINKKHLAGNGVNALLRQVFVEGFFHADPHPGNYFALPGSVFAFIDYGMVGRLSTRDRRELAAFFISFLSQDSESAIKHLRHLVTVTPSSNAASFEHDADDILHEWYGAKLTDVSLADAFHRILDSGRRNRVYFPAGFTFLGKTLYTTEAMGSTLDPDFDFAKQMTPFVAKIIKQEVSPRLLKRKIMDMGLDYYSYLEEAPEKLMTLLDRLGTGRLEVKIDQEELRGFRDSLARQAARTLITAIAASVIVVTGLMVLIQSGIVAAHWNVAGPAVAVLGLLLLWSWFRLPIR